MGKITFRANDDLVDELEAFDASKSEVMREALRSYLDHEVPDSSDGTIDALVRECVDDRLDERLGGHQRVDRADVQVQISIDGQGTRAYASESDDRDTPTDRVQIREHAGNTTQHDQPSDMAHPPGGFDDDNECTQCGVTVDADHVYCPNCGEQVTHRVFCECGDEVRSDWAFCPSCGRRTPAADVLDSR